MALAPAATSSFNSTFFVQRAARRAAIDISSLVHFAPPRLTTPESTPAATPTSTMPQEKRKRGRRAEKKRKEDEPANAPEEELSNLYIEDRNGDIDNEDPENTFFGLLSEEEQEYFQRADEMLSLDQFADSEGMWLGAGCLLGRVLTRRREGAFYRKYLPRSCRQGAEDCAFSGLLAPA